MFIERFYRNSYVPRVPSRLVRYGIVYGSAAKDTIATLIKLLEEYEEATDDTPKDTKATKAKAKRKQ